MARHWTSFEGKPTSCAPQTQITPHALRHTHATPMWEAGMRELTLQRRLGHASPEATRVYTRVSDPIVVTEYRRALGLDDPMTLEPGTKV